jgi:hypothetical protein
MERGPVRYPFRIASERLVTNLRDAHSGRSAVVRPEAVTTLAFPSEASAPSGVGLDDRGSSRAELTAARASGSGLAGSGSLAQQSELPLVLGAAACAETDGGVLRRPRCAARCRRQPLACGAALLAAKDPGFCDPAAACVTRRSCAGVGSFRGCGAARALPAESGDERRGAWEVRCVAAGVPDRGGIDAGGVGRSGSVERAWDCRSGAWGEEVSALPHAPVSRRGAGAWAGGPGVVCGRWAAAA